MNDARWEHKENWRKGLGELSIGGTGLKFETVESHGLLVVRPSGQLEKRPGNLKNGEATAALELCTFEETASEIGDGIVENDPIIW